MAEVLPYELTWLGILGIPDPLRKLLKLNTEAVALILCELDFWVPFVTLCLAFGFGSASFNHEMAAAVFCFVFVFTYTVNVLLGKLAAIMINVSTISSTTSSAPTVYMLFFSRRLNHAPHTLLQPMLTYRSA